ncbi:MAG: ribonuclease H-like domain-containing protein, partial [Treponema sp.]|nr:ribonuclease H-like domain-containing protein [Treponema sp.]
MDLRSRLSRIRELKSPGEGPASQSSAAPSAEPSATPLALPGAFEGLGWKPVAYQTLQREQVLDLPITIPRVLPPALNILAPGIGRSVPESLVFFDLETSGLSIGAGTLAFLAAFGSLRAPPGGRGGKRGFGRGDHAQLHLTQYLLLDYPGEPDFLEALIGELGAHPTMVSYNGKTFDVQILRNRCLMTGMDLPPFEHADLLHSARRLWRRFLPNCSQGTVESGVLSIEREDDLPGAFAPDAWFSFLNTGDAATLLRICEHNSRDILGLASLLGCLCRIAEDPLGNCYHADPEQLWLCWWGALRRGLCGEGEYPMVRALLERGAEQGYPR